jgi:hypothetical protein
MPKQVKKLWYRVKDGRTFGAVNEYKAGSEVQLFPHEAKGFMDKLILLDPQPSKSHKAKKVTQPDGDLKNELNMEVESLIQDDESSEIDLSKG